MVGQPGFFDVEERLRELSAKGDDLERIAVLVDFALFRAELERALPRSDGAKGGRPAFDHVLMFKILLLQAMHGLSDERCEYLIKDRLSFMRFLGLGLADPVPDANTIWAFREALSIRPVTAEAEAEAERLRIEERLASLASAAQAVPIVPHPKIAESYRRPVEELEGLLGETSTEASEALEVVRGLIERVTIVVDGLAPDGIWLEIQGDLAHLLTFSEARQQKPPKVLAVGGLQLSVDAGTGFEPVTFRL